MGIDAELVKRLQQAVDGISIEVRNYFPDSKLLVKFVLDQPAESLQYLAPKFYERLSQVPDSIINSTLKAQIIDKPFRTLEFEHWLKVKKAIRYLLQRDFVSFFTQPTKNKLTYFNNEGENQRDIYVVDFLPDTYPLLINEEITEKNINEKPFTFAHFVECTAARYNVKGAQLLGPHRAFFVEKFFHLWDSKTKATQEDIPISVKIKLSISKLYAEYSSVLGALNSYHKALDTLTQAFEDNDLTPEIFQVMTDKFQAATSTFLALKENIGQTINLLQSSNAPKLMAEIQHLEKQLNIPRLLSVETLSKNVNALPENKDYIPCLDTLALNFNKLLSQISNKENESENINLQGSQQMFDLQENRQIILKKRNALKNGVNNEPLYRTYNAYNNLAEDMLKYTNDIINELNSLLAQNLSEDEKAIILKCKTGYYEFLARLAELNNGTLYPNGLFLTSRFEEILEQLIKYANKTDNSIKTILTNPGSPAIDTCKSKILSFQTSYRTTLTKFLEEKHGSFKTFGNIPKLLTDMGLANDLSNEDNTLNNTQKSLKAIFLDYQHGQLTHLEFYRKLRDLYYQRDLETRKSFEFFRRIVDSTFDREREEVSIIKSISEEFEKYYQAQEEQLYNLNNDYLRAKRDKLNQTFNKHSKVYDTTVRAKVVLAHAETAITKKVIDPDTILLKNEDNLITAYWVKNNKLKSQSFEKSKIDEIGKLPNFPTEENVLNTLNANDAEHSTKNRAIINFLINECKYKGQTVEQQKENKVSLKKLDIEYQNTKQWFKGLNKLEDKGYVPLLINNFLGNRRTRNASLYELRAQDILGERKFILNSSRNRAR